jgi:hypothetical protein
MVCNLAKRPRSRTSLRLIISDAMPLITTGRLTEISDTSSSV